MNRFDVLDSFRGICALLVAFMHLQALHHFYFSPFVRHSFLFVDFFFVLSGFVIAHAYRQRLHTSRDAARFVVRRFGRVWPLHIAVLIALILAQLAALAAQSGGIRMPKAPFTDNWSIDSIVSNILLLQSLGVHHHGTWNLPSWSISAELWAYLTFAAVVLLARKQLVLVSALLVAIGLAVILRYSPDFIDATYDFGYFRCIAGFFTGVLVEYFWRPIRLSRKTATTIEIAVLLGVIAFVTYGGGTIFSLAAPFVFGLTVFLFASETGAVSQLLRTKPFRALGLWSYSIYMVHSIYYLVLLRNGPRVLEQVLHAPLMANVPHEGELRPVLAVGGMYGTDLVAIGYLVAVVATAAITYRFIEDPARRWFYALPIGQLRKVAPAAKT